MTAAACPSSPSSSYALMKWSAMKGGTSTLATYKIANKSKF